MKYMLDTNMCIYIIKRHPENVLKKFTALDVGSILVTNNKKEFSRVPNLKIEDWVHKR